MLGALESDKRLILPGGGILVLHQAGNRALGGFSSENRPSAMLLKDS
jgi:hypothetical protein